MKNIDLNQGRLSQALADQIMDLIEQYDETLHIPTVVGCLELVKQQIVMNHGIWTNNEENDE